MTHRIVASLYQSAGTRLRAFMRSKEGEIDALIRRSEKNAERLTRCDDLDSSGARGKRMAIILERQPITLANFFVQVALRCALGEDLDEAQAESMASCGKNATILPFEAKLLQGDWDALQAARKESSKSKYYQPARYDNIERAWKAIYGGPARSPMVAPAETWQAIESRRVAAVRDGNDYGVQEAHRAADRYHRSTPSRRSARREFDHEED